MTDNNSSIRLSQFNPELKGKLSKFDTLNDGALSLEEAVQGLVTLQKQSNNYKRLLYLQVPIMLALLACMLGINILAINITKSLQTSSNDSQSGFSLLTDKSNNPVMVSNFAENVDLFYFLSSASALTYNDVKTLQFGGDDNTPLLVLPLDAIMVNNTNNITVVTVTFTRGWFTLTSDGTIYDYDVKVYDNDKVSNAMFDIIKTSLSEEVDKQNSMGKSQKASKNTKPLKITVVVLNKPQVPGACAAAGFKSSYAFG